MASLTKKYLYQVYSNTNAFLGTFQNVISEFGYEQNINSGGAELEVVLANAFDDVGATQTSEFWLDESGNKTIDESGNYVVWSATNNFNNIPIALNNRVKVYLAYDSKPSGVQVFDGFISRWQANYAANTITITVLSYGTQFDNYLLNADPAGQQIYQSVYDKEYTASISYKPTVSNVIAQSFNIGSATTIGAFTVTTRASASDFIASDGTTVSPVAVLIWQLYSGTPVAPGSLIDSGSYSYTGTGIRDITLQLTKPLSLNGSYYLVLSSGNAGTQYYADPVLEATSTNPYAGGSVYTGVDTAGAGPVWTAVPADDLAFSVISSTGSNNLVFSNNDPSTILQRIIEQLVAQGGLPTYNSTSIDATSTSVSYTYKVQTILEGFNKVLQLAPDGWYWYLDVALNIIHFHRAANSAEHTLVLGRHIKDLNLEYSLEGVVNTVYFSGGPTAGVNLYIAQKDAASASKYGQWLKKSSDNRVTDTTTAGVLASGELATKSQPVFRTTVEVLAADFDIENFSLGDMLVFRGFNNLIDRLIFQIVSIRRTPDVATLTLGTSPPRASSELENVRRRLDLLDTIDNPTAPS